MVDEDGVYGDARVEARGFVSSVAGEDLLAFWGDVVCVCELVWRG